MVTARLLGRLACASVAVLLASVRASAQETPLVVSFESVNYRVLEGEELRVSVVLTPAPDREVTIPITAVPYAVAGAPAEEGDYTVLGLGAGGALTFAVGDAVETFVVRAEEDNRDNEIEDVELDFGSLPSGVTSARLDKRHRAMLRILDNDWKATLSKRDNWPPDQAFLVLPFNDPEGDELDWWLDGPDADYFLVEPFHHGGFSYGLFYLGWDTVWDSDVKDTYTFIFYLSDGNDEGGDPDGGLPDHRGVLVVTVTPGPEIVLQPASVPGGTETEVRIALSRFLPANDRVTISVGGQCGMDGTLGVTGGGTLSITTDGDGAANVVVPFTAGAVAGDTRCEVVATGSVVPTGSIERDAASAALVVERSGPEGPALTDVRADPETITVGGKSTLSWTPRGDVESVVVSAGDEELGTVFAATATSHEVTPAETTTYTLSAQDGEGAPLGDFPVTVTVLPRSGGANSPPVANDDRGGSVAFGKRIAIGAGTLLGNDSDPDGDPLTITRVFDPRRGAVSMSGTTVTFTHDGASAASEGYAFTYTVSDGNGGTDDARVTGAVTRTNRAPTVSASCDPCEVAPGGEVALSAAASDPDDDPLTYAWSAPRGGFAGAADGATARWAAPAQTGRVTIRVQVSDGRGGTASADVAVEVADRPPAFKQSVYRFELPKNLDGSRRPVELGRVVAEDPEGDALTYELVSGDGERFAIRARDGVVTYVGPGEDFETEPNRYDLVVRARDAFGAEARARVVVTVTNANDAPEAVDDEAETPEDETVTVDVLANDTDADGDRLRVETVSAAAHGTAAVAGGAVTYAPAANYHGADRFTYVVSDGRGGTATATVDVTVLPVNDAPEAVDDEAETPEDETVTVDVLANDTDADGDRLRVETVSAAAHGTAAVAGGAVTYAPAANYHGADRFTYVVSDGRGGTATATVDVTVLPVNDAPEAVDDEAETPEDETVTVDVLANDTDADGDRLRVETVSAAAHGTAAVAGGAVTYAPAANYHGADRFTYVVSDGRGGTATATVDVTVLPVNDAPEAVDDEAETPEDETVTVDVLANDTDADGDRLRVETVSAAAHGTAAVAGGAVTYAPAANYHGADRFTYVVSDGRGGTATATVDVTVLPVNDAPEAVDDEAETPEDETVTVDVLANDTDADGDRLRVETVSAAAHGTAAVAGGAVTYAPAANYHGADRFTYVVSDGRGGTATATVDVTVLPVNDAPEAVDDEAETPEDETVTVDVLANDTDADGDRLRVETVSAAAHGTAAVAGGAVTYAPAANYHGADRFTYVVSDGRGLADTATVEVTVLPVNDAPEAVGVIPDQVLDEGGGEATVDLTPFFDDPDGDALTFRATSSDTDIATVTVAGAVLTLTPVAPGAVSVAVTAEDPGGLTATHAFAAGVGDRLSRAVLGNTLAAVARSHLASARMTLGRRVTADPGEGSRLTVHGRSVPLGTAAARDAVGRMAMNWLSGFERRAERFSNVPPGLAAAPGGGPGLPALNGLSAGTLPGLGGLGRGGPDMLRGTDFLLAWGGGDGRDEARRGRRWRLWGQGDIQTFEGAPSAASDYDGDLRTAYLGLDTRPTDRWLAGLALARSRGAGDWRAGTARGRLTTTLTAVHPYAHWSDGATAVWAMIGGGRGTAENARDATGGVETSALGLRMGLVEARRRIGAAGGGVQFAVRGDAAWARLATGRGEQTVDAQRAAVNQRGCVAPVPDGERAGAGAVRRSAPAPRRRGRTERDRARVRRRASGRARHGSRRCAGAAAGAAFGDRLPGTGRGRVAERGRPGTGGLLAVAVAALGRPGERDRCALAGPCLPPAHAPCNRRRMGGGRERRLWHEAAERPAADLVRGVRPVATWPLDRRRAVGPVNTAAAAGVIRLGSAEEIRSCVGAARSGRTDSHRLSVRWIFGRLIPCRVLPLTPVAVVWRADSRASVAWVGLAMSRLPLGLDLLAPDGRRVLRSGQ